MRGREGIGSGAGERGREDERERESTSGVRLLNISGALSIINATVKLRKERGIREELRRGGMISGSGSL